MSRPEKKEITTNLSQVSSAEVIASTSQLNTDSEGMAIIPRNASFSSVEIEPSTSENSRRSNRVTRSQSLSRTLIRSFRRKKKSTHSDESAGEKNQIGDTNDSRNTGANETPGGETVEKDAVPKSGEEQSKISRILRMNSISRFKLRRNKSVSSLNEALNVKRSTSLVNFFRREKKEKVCATVDAEITTTECEDQLGTKKSRLRDSMRRFRSNKSSSTSTEDEEGAATSASEKNRWRPRRSISMFGSSFNLKKIFHSEPVSEEVADDITNQDPILGAMKRSESSRQKLSQLTSMPGEVGATSEGCNDSEKTRRNSIGEKLKAGRNLFKRDSFILKKSSTSKTSNPVEEPTEETSASSEILIENDTNLGQDESQPTSNSHKLDEDKQAVADDDSHNSSKLQIQQQISGTSQLELKNHQEKPFEETNQTKEAKTVTQEANGTDYNRLSRYREYCIDCGYMWGDWILQSCLVPLIRPVFDVGFLFLFLLCLISCGLSRT